MKRHYLEASCGCVKIARKLVAADELENVFDMFIVSNVTLNMSLSRLGRQEIKVTYNGKVLYADCTRYYHGTLDGLQTVDDYLDEKLLIK